ncbi:MAG: DNA (cytosine-5-)-methyltransferase [Clostridiales bacterium]|nr:DNA (cytosine-5-)-methyltransferase [Clostridiales bacterium]
MLKVATVFSGIGAIEFALKRMGVEHEIVFACDNGEREVNIDYVREMPIVKSLSSPIEKRDYVAKLYATATKCKNYMEESYKANYDVKDGMFFQDVCLLDGRDFYGQVDLFVGGSPCQSFSSVGFEAGLDDTRGTLFYEFGRLVEEIQPKVFIYENVRNMLQHDKGKTWTVIKSVFDKLNYDIKFDVLNASDYGIPQTRRRLFVIGIRKDVPHESLQFPPQPIELKYKAQDFLIESCAEGHFMSLDGNVVAENMPGEIDEKYFLTPKLKNYVMCTGTKTFSTPIKIDLPVARTLLKTMGNRHRAGVDNYYTVNGRIRMLSEREALRLMGFTDDFKQVVSRAQMYKQAGNSIVVDVMIAVLKAINKSYKLYGGKNA